MTRDKAQERIRNRQLARLGALFAGFAHEIRNPLSTVSLNLQLVQEDLQQSKNSRDRRVHRRLAVIEAEVKRLQAILDEFLGYVRVPKLDRKPTKLNQLLQGMIDFILPEMEAKGVSLRFYADPRVGEVMLDREKFTAVMVNLLRNALEACETGDEVMVASKLEADHVLMQVTDTGKGMEAAVQAKAFTPYFSTKKAGTGLGLPTARRLIELHDGELDFNSETDRGTQFAIRLPLATGAVTNADEVDP